MNKTIIKISLLMLMTIVIATTASALDDQENKDTGAGTSADAVAKELANPNNSLASLNFKNQYRWYTGDLPHADSQDNYTLLFQPVFPFGLTPPADGGKANLFIRPAIPLLVKQPYFDAGKGDFESDTALGDIGFDIGYGVTKKSGWLWAIGMVGTLPTATDSDFAGKQLRLGPEGLIAKFYDWGLWGIFPSHQWDVAGWEGGYFSTTQIQMVLKFLPGNGLSVGTAPIMNYDWKSDDWTIPLNLDISKTIMWGGIPLKIGMEINYYIEQPDLFGPEWMIGFNITPVVPNFVDRWVKGL